MLSQTFTCYTAVYSITHVSEFDPLFLIFSMMFHYDGLRINTAENARHSSNLGQPPSDIFWRSA